MQTLTLSIKDQEIAAICSDFADKYLESDKNFGFITGSAFLSLAVLLFLRVIVA